jgi:hypothetical protein
MALQTGLSPNPNRPGVISRVVILGEQDGQALVLGGTSRFVTRTALSRTDHEQTEGRLPGDLLAAGIDPSETFDVVRIHDRIGL